MGFRYQTMRGFLPDYAHLLYRTMRGKTPSPTGLCVPPYRTMRIRHPNRLRFKESLFHSGYRTMRKLRALRIVW